MNKSKAIQHNKARRVIRTRSRIKGTADRPRLAVFRSNRYMEIQLIDDVLGKTLVYVSGKGLSGGASKNNKTSQALIAGKKIAEKALAAGIKRAILDRRSYKYHGRVKAVAEGARMGGLII